MHYPVFFFIFLAFVSGNPSVKEQAASKPLTDSVICPNTMRPKAWYKYDRNTVTTNARYVYEHDNTSPLTNQPENFIISIDTNYNAKKEHVIRIANNSTNIVFLQTQDGSFMAVMQGLSKSGQWCSLEHWQFSKCGNSYHTLGFLPNSKGTFVAQLPRQGNYETKFRFKLLGKDKFYYSEEFTGKIDYCAFRDSTVGGFALVDTSILPRRALYTLYLK